MLRRELMQSFQGADHEVDGLEVGEDVVLAIIMMVREEVEEEGPDD